MVAFVWIVSWFWFRSFVVFFGVFLVLQCFLLMFYTLVCSFRGISRVFSLCFQWFEGDAKSWPYQKKDLEEDKTYLHEFFLKRLLTCLEQNVLLCWCLLVISFCFMGFIWTMLATTSSLSKEKRLFGLSIRAFLHV